MPGKLNNGCPECKGDPRGVLLLDSYVPCQTCAAAKAEAKRPAKQTKITQHAIPGKRLSIPGVGVGAALAWLPIETTRISPTQVKRIYDYVEQRECETHALFVHVRRRWVETDKAGPVGLGSRKILTTTESSEVLFYHGFLTRQEALASIGPDARMNP